MAKHFPGVPLTFLSIKISPVRSNIADKIRYANELIKNEIQKNPDYRYVDIATPLLGSNGQPRQEFFEKDGLHLSPAGYRVWQQSLLQAQIFNNLLIPQPL